MLRKLLDRQLAYIEANPRLKKFRPLVSALDVFFYKVDIQTKKRPFVRDSVDLKRWMMLVIFALVPCIFMSIWNSGLLDLVYTSGSYELMDEYLKASHSLSGYFGFCFSKGRWLDILWRGGYLFLPLVLISYAVGGLWEGIFACLRGHEINEGFLVSGMLFPLTLPPTIPYWMAVLGISFGIVVGKELFGGTGMNILNPALTCRAFLFFSFPARMTGDVWVGSLPAKTSASLTAMNEAAHKVAIDGYAQASAFAKLNIPDTIKRIHVEAIGAHMDKTDGLQIAKYFNAWKNSTKVAATHLKDLSPTDLKAFITEGLGLEPSYLASAIDFAKLKYGAGILTDGNFLFGNMIGSFGETSKIAVALGALFLIYVGIGSWRTMLAVILGVLGSAALFQFGSHIGADSGLWNPAKFDLPFYKHLLLGSVFFGAIFFATDPVSSPYSKAAKWIYGIGIGALTVVIRLINPAYPEGTMLAILFMNVFTPLLDYHMVRRLRRRRYVPTA